MKPEKLRVFLFVILVPFPWRLLKGVFLHILDNTVRHPRLKLRITFGRFVLIKYLGNGIKRRLGSTFAELNSATLYD